MKTEQIPITTNTLNKIISYARLMGRDECYGFLLTPANNNDRIIYNAILAPDQQVSGSSAGIDETAAAKAKAEIENMQCKALGFWHSHAGFGSFHSHVDDGNLESLLVDFAMNSLVPKQATRQINEWEIGQNYLLASLNGKSMRFNFGTLDGVTIRQQKALDGIKDRFEYCFPDKHLYIVSKGRLLSLEDVDMPTSVSEDKSSNEESGEGIVYSIVVNPRGEVYAEQAKVLFCYGCGNNQVRKFKDIGIKKIDSDKDTIFSEDELKREIEAKIKKSAGFLSFFRKKDKSGEITDNEERTSREILTA